MVGDCSFVCSLAISADYERRFNIPLITNRLFPRRNGLPAFNPCGKYVVKLHFNGVWRKVVRAWRGDGPCQEGWCVSNEGDGGYENEHGWPTFHDLEFNISIS